MIYAADNEDTAADTPLTVIVRGDLIRTQTLRIQ